MSKSSSASFVNSDQVTAPAPGAPAARRLRFLAKKLRSAATLLCSLLIFFLLPATALAANTPLVTGNGFGFGVFSFSSMCLSRFYAHPYKFEKPDPKDPLGEGIETANFIKRMYWGEIDPKANVDYLDQSQIIAVSGKQMKQFFFMPFALEQNVLIAASVAEPGSRAKPVLNVDWQNKVLSKTASTIESCNVRILRFAKQNEGLAIVPLGPVSGQNKSTESQQLQGHSAWAFVSFENPKQLAQAVKNLKRWEAKRTVNQLVDAELKEVESWRTKCTPHFRSDAERKLWRQSEMVLRMAQSREANRPGRNNHGLIIASLPDGAWFVPWVRDMAYASMALSKMGHQTEARWALESLFNARPVGVMQKELANLPYQISVVRYFGDGSEEAYFTMEGAKNIELDDWGLALLVLGSYMEQYHDRGFLDTKTYRGSIYDSAKQYIVKPLLANLEPYKDGLIVAADTSIWEERQKNKKHFGFSTIAAISGLKSFDKLAVQRSDASLHTELQNKIALLEKGYFQAYVQEGKLRGALEEGVKNEVDGASLSAITMGIVSQPQIIQNAIAEMESLKMPSGGYRRVTSIVKDPAIFEYWYERQEFLFINFLMAEVYLKLGMPDKADALVGPMIDKAAQDHDFIPEMYVSEVNYRFTGSLGTPTGAIPMVGYGAGVFIDYLLERDKPR